MPLRYRHNCSLTVNALQKQTSVAKQTGLFLCPICPWSVCAWGLMYCSTYSVFIKPHPKMWPGRRIDAFSTMLNQCFILNLIFFNSDTLFISISLSCQLLSPFMPTPFLEKDEPLSRRCTAISSFWQSSTTWLRRKGILQSIHYVAVSFHCERAYSETQWTNPEILHWGRGNMF